LLNSIKFFVKFRIKNFILNRRSKKNIEGWQCDNCVQRKTSGNKGRDFYVENVFQFDHNCRSLYEGYTDYFQSELFSKKDGIFLEAGFLRSVLMDGTGSEYDKAKAFFIDQYGPHYIPWINTNLVRLLNSKKFHLKHQEEKRVDRLIREITTNRITKYNNQKNRSISGGLGLNGVLVVEQAVDDWAVQFSKGNRKVFKKMLNDALQENPDCKVYVKLHPDSIDKKKKKKSYYSNVLEGRRIVLITEKVNPYQVFKYVDKVYCLSSMMGFEALLVGKEVHVYGGPCYAGWGLTIDKNKKLLQARTQKRTLQEVFYAIYIELQVYINNNGEVCEIEEFLNELKINLRKYNDEIGHIQ